MTRRRAAPVPRHLLGRAGPAGRGVAARLRARLRARSGARRGERRSCSRLVRAMVAQLATFHAPDDLLIAVCFSAGPARRSGSGPSGCRTRCTRARPTRLGPVRLAATSVRALEELPRRRARRPGAVQPGAAWGQRARARGSPHRRRGARRRGAARQPAPDDGGRHRRRDAARPGRATAAPAGPGDAGARSGARAGSPRSPPMKRATVGAADTLGATEAEALARQLAPMRLAAAPGTTDAPAGRELGLAELLGIGDPGAFDRRPGVGAPAAPRQAAGADRRRARTGRPVELDLKESAQDGMGPHGLLIGATGSGKSELLRTLVLALAATHSSETLNFVLVDFKGGATLRPARPAAAHRRRHHQPGRRAHPGRPHARRDPRRADAPAGAAAPRRQLRLTARLRAGPGRRRGARAAAQPADHLRRVLRAADRQARLHRPVRADRPGRPVARRAPAAGLAAARGGPAARPGHAPVLPDRPADVLRDGVARGARRARRLRAAPLARARLPQVRHRAADPVQGRLRLRALPADRRGPERRRSHRSRPGASTTTPTTFRFRPSRPSARRARDAAAATACSTCWSGRLAGQGPPAHQVWLPPLSTSATLDELLGPVATDAERGRVRRQPRAARRPAGADRARRQAVRAAPRPAVAGPGRRRRPRRGGRRPAERQVDRAAHAGLRRWR